jgi:hypothetical protein
MYAVASDLPALGGGTVPLCVEFIDISKYLFPADAYA